jgi:single-stranded DNA-binding protein
MPNININYFGGIVKVLEDPIPKLVASNMTRTDCRVQLSQVRTNQIARLVFWGNLARDVVDYYKSNDYLLVEGYIKLSKHLNLTQVEITVSKVYPLLLNYNPS